MDAHMVRIAGVDPRGHGVVPCRPLRQPLPKALAAEHPQFQLGDIEPGAVPRGAPAVARAGDAPGVGGRNRVIERGGPIGVEMVDDHDHALRAGDVHIDHLTHGVRPVDPGAVRGDGDVAPSPGRGAEPEQVRPAVAAVGRIVAGGGWPDARDSGARVWAWRAWPDSSTQPSGTAGVGGAS